MSEAVIYRALRKAGLSRAGALGIMGNIGAESAFRSNNVEDRCPISDELYTAGVDNGTYSRDQFMRDPDPVTGKSQAYGYGLCQWTYYTRKAELYDLAKARGTSIADIGTQIELLITELKRDYPNLYSFLRSCESLYDATQRFCDEFERPYYSNVADRFRIAVRCANEPYDSEDVPEDPEPAEPAQEPAGSCDITVRILGFGSRGRDVYLLQCGLYDVGLYHTKEDGYARLDGDFGLKTQAAVSSFRRRNNLPDGNTADQDVWQVMFQ